ncbi:hypothetical protein M0812_24627 [Anaeramoeba flamelloides]|uniref:RRM domain-containing protein n=1 Tax=Anaeramoeba flamelloides TaxID=1746091 RepID=A0AAV7YHG1_9EUKA|nr:hypothetical protein M0812_24627 [Anaeramoeba flamelloides]
MIRKLFFKNLPSKYSIDKLVQFIEEKSQCSPNIEIIKNKKNPNNGLAKITPSSKKNEELIKQALGDNFYFEKRKIIVADYSNKKFKMKKKKKKKQKKNIYKKKTKKVLKKQKSKQNLKKTHQTMRNPNPKVPKTQLPT